MTWFKDHGAKLLTGLLTLFTAANGTEPQLLLNLFGDEGAKWAAFALSVGALAHTTLIKPSSGTDPASNTRQGGRARVGFLVLLVALGVGGGGIVTHSRAPLSTPADPLAHILR